MLAFVAAHVRSEEIKSHLGSYLSAYIYIYMRYSIVELNPGIGHPSHDRGKTWSTRSSIHLG